MRNTVSEAKADIFEPVIWLLGKAASGKTSIVAELTGQGHDGIGNGFVPKTMGMTEYPFPPERPVLRFLDTRGLADVESYDPADDVASARRMAHIVMAVVRIDDLNIEEIVATVRAARKAHPRWPVIIAQTSLHNTYPRNGAHIEPYPFKGNEADFGIPGLPGVLRKALGIQRALFAGLPGDGLVLFVPLDFTQPDHGLSPADYGADALIDALERAHHGLAEVIDDFARRDLKNTIRTKVILPWAFAAAATNAVPVPVAGGLGSASLQAVMVSNIAARFGLNPGIDLWKEFLSVIGVGFLAGYGGGWLVQQILKMAPGPGTAAVAAWTFAVTWGLGEAALYFFGERAAGRTASQAELKERYKAAFKKARDYYKNWKEPQS